jgi:hypothetical protein
MLAESDGSRMLDAEHAIMALGEPGEALIRRCEHHDRMPSRCDSSSRAYWRQ